MSLTVPQIIMLNHASWVNRERSEKKYDKERKDTKPTPEPEEKPTWNGVPLDKLNSSQMRLYYGGFFNGE